jgi:hypothetical protein
VYIIEMSTKFYFSNTQSSGDAIIPNSFWHYTGGSNIKSYTYNEPQLLSGFEKITFHPFNTGLDSGRRIINTMFIHSKSLSASATGQFISSNFSGTLKAKGGTGVSGNNNVHSLSIEVMTISGTKRGDLYSGDSSNKYVSSGYLNYIFLGTTKNLSVFSGDVMVFNVGSKITHNQPHLTSSTSPRMKYNSYSGLADATISSTPYSDDTKNDLIIFNQNIVFN